MAIVEVRVDDRLIHDQVCGYWIPQFDVQRILIVDNEIVNDENRKVSLKFGTPPRCKLSIFDSKKAAEKLLRKIDEGIRVMILVRSPEPLAEMLDYGYTFDHVTVGNMSTKDGAKQIRNNMFVNEKEAAAFKKIKEHNIPMYYQITPNVSKDDISKEF